MNIVSKAFTCLDSTHPAGKEVDYALLVMRVAVAVFFITHGFSKLTGIDGFTGMLVGMGFPLAVLFAWLVAIAEFFGGIAILLGVLTRFSALWLTIISLVAWVVVKGFTLGMVTIMPNGNPMGGGDIDLLAIGLTLALLIAGPGALSLSEKMKKHDHTEM